MAVDKERADATQALQQAIDTADVEHLAAALLLHTAACPELLAEARALRNRLRHQHKKKRQKNEKLKAATEALQRAVNCGTDVAALVVAIEAAERMSAAPGSELGGSLDVARERLQYARGEETAAQKVAAIETMEDEFVALALSHGACAEEEFDECQDIDDEKSCVVCLSEAKEICLFPCRHVCVCSCCAERLFSEAERLCPVCRAPIEDKFKVFL